LKTKIEVNKHNFFKAIKEGNLEKVRLFLKEGMNPNVKKGGMTALLEATRRGFEEIALALIERGANVNDKDEYGVTALMYAAITGSKDLILSLIAKGAEVNAKDLQGRTVLIEALTTENDLPLEVIKAIIDAGAEVNVRSDSGVTPIMLAAPGSTEVLRLLIEAGADVNAQDEEGFTALMRAKRNPENVRILKEAGAKR